MNTYPPRLLRAVLALCTAALLLGGWWFTVAAWDEEDIDYYDPLDAAPLAVRATYTPTVSTVHFDLVGALAIAAGFAESDAARIQAYSQATDSGPLPGRNPVYTFDADPARYPVPPPLTAVTPTPFCPAPDAIDPTVAFGLPTRGMECPGCFTSRYGPYGLFFHEPHDTPRELGAIRSWALGETPSLTGIVVFGYSSTVESAWQGAANIYSSAACFITRTAIIDTGSIDSGSLAAFGIYLHSLGDSWSHRDCIAAVDALGLPFAAHVAAKGPQDPLWPCRWTAHSAEFGDAVRFPDSNRTITGTLALYEALADFAATYEHALFRPIPLMAEEGHLYNTLAEFAHAAADPFPQTRRRIADDLRLWALQTRAAQPVYWRGLYLPLLHF